MVTFRNISHLTGDFSAQQSEYVFDSFLYQHDLTNLVKKGTCYKNPGNPSCIDIFDKQPIKISKYFIFLLDFLIFIN